MTICGSKTKRNEVCPGVLHLTKTEIKVLERVAIVLAKKFSFSVYQHERSDLEQTIWYLMILAKGKYDSNRGIPFEAWAYYYADMKLRDHF